MSDAVTLDPFAAVVGNAEAARVLRDAASNPVHAYLLVGPAGAGHRALAVAFAAAYLSAGRDDAERHVHLALAESHPDLVVVERVGASISVEQAEQIVDRANRTAVESNRKVLVLDEFHLVAPQAAAKLLKMIEEPSPGTVFVVLADEVSPALVTIASRCSRIKLAALAESEVVAALEAAGVGAERAAEAAAAARGNLDRARVLAGDDRVALRQQAWRAVPTRLDGSGASAVAAVDELLAMIDESLEPLRELHVAELAALEARVEATGERGAGRKDLADRHKRQERRHRTDELRFGLLTLADHYRALLDGPRATGAAEALAAISATLASLVRNPNERLQLQALFVRLGDAG